MRLTILILTCAAALTAQTINGGRTVLGPVDNSGAATTKPMKAGTTLPGTCAVGELFYDTDATAGQNVYGCTATNTWTQQGGSSGHTQNTDTGTTSPTFQLNSGSSGSKLKDNAGVVEVRNAADDAYSVFHALSFVAGDGTVAGELIAQELAANGTNYVSWLAPDAITATYRLKFPDALPTAGQYLAFGVPSAGVSQGSWATPAGGDMLVSTYDPLGKSANAFSADNHVDGITNKVYTATEKTKLAGVAAGATVGADWSINVTNKPTLGTAAAKNVGSTSADVAAGNASTTVNGQPCTLNSTCTVADSTKTVPPATNTDSYIPQWDGANSKTLKNGLAVAQAATASAVVQRNASAEVIAANTVATGKTPMATDTAVQASQMPAFSGDATTSAGAVVLALAAKHKTHTKSLSLLDPVVGDSGRVQLVFPSASTVTWIGCAVGGGTSVTINIDKRAWATPGTTGTSVLSAGLVCDTNGQTACASGCDANTISSGSITARAPNALTISAVSGTNTELRVYVEYTIN